MKPPEPDYDLMDTVRTGWPITPLFFFIAVVFVALIAAYVLIRSVSPP